MLWWGAALALLGGLVTLGASVWLTVEIAGERAALNRSRAAWDQVRQEEAQARSEFADRYGDDMDFKLSRHVEWLGWSEERRAQTQVPMELPESDIPQGAMEDWQRLQEFDVRERDTGEQRTWDDFEAIGKRDIERAQANSAWRIQTRQGAVAAFGGFVAVVGALLTFLGS